MPTRTMWAVIQTGTITPDADIVPFKTDGGKRTPAILFINEDYEKVARKRKSLVSRFARFTGFGGGAPGDLQLCTPVLGVVQLTEEFKAKAKPAASTAPTANGTPPEVIPIQADKPKPGRKSHKSQPAEVAPPL